ncbi:MAG: hypothetical protein J7K68_05320 [Candidatus Diapherotrites archaeon]|nr:hypothetical protein [Candidatus Diapherotrites archaeon]
MTVFKPENVLRYPRLDTILMVEEFIQKHSGKYSKKQVWEKLPRKTMYQTYCTIIDYLEYSNKIIFDREKKIVWIWDPEGVRKLLSKGLIVK